MRHQPPLYFDYDLYNDGTEPMPCLKDTPQACPNGGATESGVSFSNSELPLAHVLISSPEKPQWSWSNLTFQDDTDKVDAVLENDRIYDIWVDLYLANSIVAK